MLRPSPAAVPTRDKGAMRSPAAGRLTSQAVRGVVTTSLQPEERSVEGEKGSPIVGIENTPLAFVVVLETFCPVHWNTIPASVCLFAGLQHYIISKCVEQNLHLNIISCTCILAVHPYI